LQQYMCNAAGNESVRVEELCSRGRGEKSNPLSSM